MKYLFAHIPRSQDHEGSERLVAAKTVSQAKKLLREGRADSTLYTFKELSPLAFREMQDLKLFPTYGDTSFLDLDAQSESERLKTVARNLSEQLQRSGHNVALGQLQTALAASLGQTNWQVHGQDVRRPAKTSLPSKQVTGAGTQSTMTTEPNSLWEVPVTVNVTATANVRVRADTQEQAIRLALEQAAQGGVSFSMDRENVNGPDDYYVPDDDAVRCLGTEKELAASQGWYFAQSGDYRVSTYLLEAEDGLLWADLDIVSNAAEEDDEQSCGCLSSLPATSTREEQEAFCFRIAKLLNDHAPEPKLAGMIALESAFIQAAQGGTSPESYEAMARKLRQSVEQEKRRQVRS